MIVLYLIKCKDCKYEVTGETEYFSGKYWFCEKCNSRKLRIHLEVVETHRKEKSNVTNSTRLSKAREPQAVFYRNFDRANKSER